MTYKVTVEPVLLFYMLSTFMLYPALQDLIYTKVCINSYPLSTCNNLYDPTNYEALDNVQSSSSHWILASTFMLTVPSLLSAQMLGSWSDVYGKKLLLLLPPIGGAFASLVYIGLSANLKAWPVSLILLASFFSGITGGFSSCILLCMSYISEITDVESRTVRVSILEAMTLIGGTLGPLITGWIHREAGRNVVFLTIMSLFTLIIFYIIIYIEDVLPRSVYQETLTRGPLWSLRHIKDPVATILESRRQNRRLFLLLLLLSAALIFFCSLGEMDISYIFVADTPFKWNLSSYSSYMSVKYGLGSFSLLFILPIVRKLSDSVLISIGITSKILGYIIIGFAQNSFAIYASAAFGSLHTWSIPVIRASMSKLVESGEQGKMFACIAVVENICGVFATLVFNSLYPELRHTFKGLIFLLEASLLIIPLMITCYLQFALRKLYSYVEINDDIHHFNSGERQLSLGSSSSSLASASPIESPELLSKTNFRPMNTSSIVLYEGD